MTDGTSKSETCGHVEGVAAYLDGEMDAPAADLFEAHVKGCRPCAASLGEQRRILCLLDTTFDSRAVELPKDFARIVTARAQNDMGGVRSASERAFSAKLSLMLAASAALLLGASASESVFAPAAAFARSVAGALGMLGHALIDAGVGAVVILRVVGGRLVSGPHTLTALYWVLFTGAAVLLLRLIRSYHRAH